jgi:hypothetical protein
MLARDCGGCCDGIKGGRCSRAGGGNDGARFLASRDVGFDQATQLIRPHGEGIVVGDMAEVVTAEARQQSCLVD